MQITIMSIFHAQPKKRFSTWCWLQYPVSKWFFWLPHEMGSIFYLRPICARSFSATMHAFSEGKSMTKMISSILYAQSRYGFCSPLINVGKKSPVYSLNFAPSPSMLSFGRSFRLRSKSKFQHWWGGKGQNQHWKGAKLQKARGETPGVYSVNRAEVKNRTHHMGG